MRIFILSLKFSIEIMMVGNVKYFLIKTEFLKNGNSLDLTKRVIEYYK